MSPLSEVDDLRVGAQHEGVQKWLSLLKPRVEIMDTGKRRGTACRARSQTFINIQLLFQHPHAVPNFIGTRAPADTHYYPVPPPHPLDIQNICAMMVLRLFSFRRRCVSPLTIAKISPNRIFTTFHGLYGKLHGF